MSQKYYPYFRGRQFELIALRELVLSGKLSEDIVPVVEPVKASTTLFSTIKEFSEKHHEIVVVTNPEYGSFLDEVSTLPDDKRAEVTKILQSENVKYAILQNNFMEGLVSNIHKRMKEEVGRWYAVYANSEFLDKSLELSEKYGFNYAVSMIPDAAPFRRKIKSIKISFKDVFQKKARNSDYLEKADELFTEEHCYAREEGYAGTGDYSIVGGDYVDSGFAPYAVAIHVVYLAEEHKLRVRHFVSDSNDGIEDPAGKFKEAASKVDNWVREHDDACPMTLGLEMLLDSYKSGMYPGLGSLKKFTIMHHLELMGMVLHEML